MTLKYKKRRVAAVGGLLLATLGTSVPANALVINLIDNGGVTGSAAEQGFKIAANFWQSVLTNNVTVNLAVGYSALGTGIIGSTGSTKYTVAIEGVESFLAANTQKSALDQALVVPSLVGSTTLPTFGTVGTIGMVRNGPLTGTSQLSTTQVYDANNSRDNATVSGTSANLKALGYTGLTGNDATVTFSSAFAFDFDPTDGIDTDKMDFIGVAIHEIGHALGFTSGVDTYDYYLNPNGPGRTSSFNWNNQTVGNILDLFRYSNDPNNLVPGTGPVLDWSVGTASYFSIDGGNTVFNGNGYFSTGQYNGDGRQASHFKDTPSSAGGCDGFNQVGVMDPTFCYGEMGVIKNTDLAAFDAIGWNLNFNVLSAPGYTFTSAQAYNSYLGAVPEPMTWVMMIGGFALVGASMRRRTSAVAFS